MKLMVTEVENEGLDALMGQRVTLFCGVYIAFIVLIVQ